MEIELQFSSGRASLPCADWLVALIALQTIKDAYKVNRLDAPNTDGAVECVWCDGVVSLTIENSAAPDLIASMQGRKIIAALMDGTHPDCVRSEGPGRPSP